MVRPSSGEIERTKRRASLYTARKESSERKPSAKSRSSELGAFRGSPSTS